jgi:hypothetical protein
MAIMAADKLAAAFRLIWKAVFWKELLLLLLLLLFLLETIERVRF